MAGNQSTALEVEPRQPSDGGVELGGVANVVAVREVEDVNLGTIEAAAGGTVILSDVPINNAGGTIEAIGSGAVVQLFDADIQGGTLTTSGPGSSGSSIDIEPETINAPVEPEAQDIMYGRYHSRLVKIEFRLRSQELMVIILAPARRP